MKDAHYTLDITTRLLADDLSHEELLSQVFPHLAEHCPVCAEHHREILRLQKEFGHWDERVVVFEGRQAPELFAEIQDLPFDEQLGRVTDDETFQNWAFCQLLLSESSEAGFEDPGRAINLAELAVKVAQELGDAYDPHWVLDLRAKAHAYLGNAQRVLGELRSAEAAFRDAERLLLRSTTGNLLIKAEILNLKASLRRAQRRFPDALALCDESLDIYHESGDPHQFGVALLKAKILEDSEDLEAAIALLRRTVEEIDASREPRLHVYARYNLVLCLTSVGRYEEAGRLLSAIAETFLEESKPLDHIRLRWTEGKIAFGLGRIDEAEKAFRTVQWDFLDRGMGYDAALVSLDLAILLAQEGRHGELKRLAVELMQVFESRDVHREAVAALLMFQKACEEERVTAQLATQLAALLKRSRPK